MTQKCEHKNKEVIGEWTPYKSGILILVRECQDCGAIHLGNASNHYECWEKKPQWGR